jgi:hypothetical protein
MCNIYLMYYTDGETNIQDTCGDNAYPQYEKLIPTEAEIKPPPIKSDDSASKNPQHHDMEANPHSSHNVEPVVDNSQQSDGKNRKPSKNRAKQQKTGKKDDDYEDTERSRSKNRLYNEDYPSLYDIDSIIDYEDFEYPRTGSLPSSSLSFNPNTKNDNTKPAKYILKPQKTSKFFTELNFVCSSG